MLFSANNFFNYLQVLDAYKAQAQKGRRQTGGSMGVSKGDREKESKISTISTT